PAAELQLRIDCAGPQVLNASYERAVNQLTIQFSEPIDGASATIGAGNAIVITLDDGRVIAGTATTSQTIVTMTLAEDLSAKSFTVTVNTSVRDTLGNHLTTPFSQPFAVSGDQPVPGDASGFISGEVYDATSGRPLPNATIAIDVASAPPVVTSTDARGRYAARSREGAHTIKASLAGYTTVWRQ